MDITEDYILYALSRRTKPANLETICADLGIERGRGGRYTKTMARRYSAVSTMLQRLKRTGHIMLVKGSNGGWRLTRSGRKAAPKTQTAKPAKPAKRRAKKPVHDEQTCDSAVTVWSFVGQRGVSGARHAEVKDAQPRPAGWGRDLDAIEYEHQRNTEPDCRDEDDVHVWDDGTVTLTDGPVVANTFAEDETSRAKSPVAAANTTLEQDDDDRKPRKPGCKCHQEEGDSPCPVHLSDDELLAEIAYAPPREQLADQQPLRLWPPHTGTPDERFDDGGDS